MGSAYTMLKQYTLAITACEKSIALEPTGDLANMAREAIRKLRRQ